MDKSQFYADLGMDASNLNNTDVRVKMEHRIKIVTADFTSALNQATENIKAMSKEFERQSLGFKGRTND